jgi:hypothetical protein
MGLECRVEDEAFWSSTTEILFGSEEVVIVCKLSVARLMEDWELFRERIAPPKFEPHRTTKLSAA